jgi:hypothetical protein
LLLAKLRLGGRVPYSPLLRSRYHPGAERVELA